jgi:hypothetical protein
LHIVNIISCKFSYTITLKGIKIINREYHTTFELLLKVYPKETTFITALFNSLRLIPDDTWVLSAILRYHVSKKCHKHEVDTKPASCLSDGHTFSHFDENLFCNRTMGLYKSFLVCLSLSLAGTKDIHPVGEQKIKIKKVPANPANFIHPG